MAGDAAAARVGYALNWLNDRGIQGPAVALALVAASCAVADMPHPDLVWSCPEVPGLHARDTRRVYEELVASAEHSLWISTYAYYDGPQAYQDAAQTFLPRRRNKVPSIATTTGSPAGTSSATTSRAAARPSSSGLHRAREKNEWARSCGQARDKPAPASMPHTVLLPVWATNPHARPQKVQNDGAVNNGPKTASRLASDTGSGSVTSGIIAGEPRTRRRFPGTGVRPHAGGAGQAAPAAPPPRLPGPVIMDSVPGTPNPPTRTAVTRRIIAHLTRGWPRLGEPIVGHRGQYCYLAAVPPGHREPRPILRLRYQGSAGRWAIGIYRASSGQYTESELPASFGPKTGTPEEDVDDTFILYAGPRTGH